MIQFGDWKGNFHDDFEQVKRIEAARSKKFRRSIISIDRENGRMQIQGSAAEPYSTTLNECSCEDYSRRRLPCKHIYALAFEMELMDGLPEYDKCAAGSFRPRDEMTRLKTYYTAGAIKSADYIAICRVLSKMKK